MPPIEPLIALLEQTERERDGAQAEELRSRHAHAAAQAQADALLGYRGEYEQRYAAQFRGGAAGIELMRSYQGFVGRLSQAVEHQGQVARRTQAQLEHARRVLQQHEVRVASVRKLIEGRMREMRQASDRREQGTNDELAMRAAWNRLAASTPSAASTGSPASSAFAALH